MTRITTPSLTSRRTVCRPMNPAPPVTRMRFGVLTDEAPLAARGGADRRHGGLALPRLARRATGGAGGDLVRSLARAGAAGRARGFLLHRRTSLALPAAAGQRAAPSAANHPGGDPQQLGRQPDPARAKRRRRLRDAGAHPAQGTRRGRGWSGVAEPPARSDEPAAGGADHGPARWCDPAAPTARRWGRTRVADRRRVDCALLEPTAPHHRRLARAPGASGVDPRATPFRHRRTGIR